MVLRTTRVDGRRRRPPRPQTLHFGLTDFDPMIFPLLDVTLAYRSFLRHSGKSEFKLVLTLTHDPLDQTDGVPLKKKIEFGSQGRLHGRWKGRFSH